jgi:hypothetical protein
VIEWFGFVIYRTKPFPVPAGRLRIARRFIAGKAGPLIVSPEGTAERARLGAARRLQPSLRHWVAILPDPVQLTKFIDHWARWI